MSMSLGTERGRPLSAINVTPMADVMITLLIIFMVVTPMLGHDEHVRLPAAEHGLDRPADGALVVTVRDDASVLLEGHAVATVARLTQELRDVPQRGSERGRIVRVEAHAALPYERVAAVLDACRDAGADAVDLATLPRGPAR